MRDNELLAELLDWAYVVVDMDSAKLPGERYTILAVCNSLQEAEAWVWQQPVADVERGRYGIDGPKGGEG